MKVTVTIPPELADLVADALESGEYESVEQIVQDGLYLWVDLAASDVEEDDDEMLDDEALLAAMEARGGDAGRG